MVNVIELTIYVHWVLSALYVLSVLFVRLNGARLRSSFGTIGVKYVIASIGLSIWMYIVDVTQNWSDIPRGMYILLVAWALIGAVYSFLAGMVLIADLGADQYRHLPAPDWRALLRYGIFATFIGGGVLFAYEQNDWAITVITGALHLLLATMIYVVLNE